MNPKSGFLRYLFVGFAVVCGMTPSMMVSAANNKKTTAVNVGVVLDLSSWVAKMSLSCINMSVSDFYLSHPQHTATIVLHIKDSKGDVVEVIAQAMELIEKSKVEVMFMESLSKAYLLIMKLGEKAEVPIISFAPKRSTPSYLKSPYLFQVAQNQPSQVSAINAIVKSFGWKQVVAMYQDDEFGNWILADLIQALQKFDVAVGDITILANRSLFVDFTLPFTEAGIAVVVPLRHNLRNHAWVFLKPLTWQLCFFVFMGFVVWILEHRNNEGLHRGPPSHRIGTTLWFSFCTIVFAQWETLVSNLARLVVVIWFFVVFILTQSYTASLTSWLTVQQLQPITDINQIKKNDWRVGYQEGSYVLHTLQFLGIKHLVPYTSLDQLYQLFTKGSCHGGIDAVIDEIPYMKLFLAGHYDDYIMADSLFNSNGFGFAFQLGSSIVEDMSKAVLNVTEGEKMGQIQDKWLGKKIGHQSCSSTTSASADSSSSTLDLSYFQSLFLIAASVAVFSLLFYFFLLLRNQTRSLPPVVTAAFHIFRFKDGDREGQVPPPAVEEEEASPTTIAPPSPSHDSAHSVESFNEFGDPSHANHASFEIKRS